VRFQEEIAVTTGAVGLGPASITPAKLERLSIAIREKLNGGSAELRRVYLRMFVGRVVVSKREVQISGPKSALAKAASADGPPRSEVLSFVREWRPIGEGTTREKKSLI
jgi:site-specific DNA recombinase